MSSGFRTSPNVINLGGTPGIQEDLIANQPATPATGAGTLFIGTDNNNGYRWDGSAWQKLWDSTAITITGGGTPGTLPVFTAATVVGNSLLTVDTYQGQTRINSGYFYTRITSDLLLANASNLPWEIGGGQVAGNTNMSIGYRNPASTLNKFVHFFQTGRMRLSTNNTDNGNLLQVDGIASITKLFVNATSNDGSNNSLQVVGKMSLEDNSTNHNTVVGRNSLGATATGQRNVVVGTNSLQVTSSSDNVVIGYSTMPVATTGGAGTTVIGSGALSALTTGQANVAVGKNAGDGSNGSNNVMMGYYSGRVLNGSNVSIGYEALFTCTGSSNVAVGSLAGFSSVTASGNVFLGAAAGYNETGSNKLYISNSNTTTPLILGDFSANTLTFNASITTSAPTGGAGAWKLGLYTAGAIAATGIVTISINGTTYKLLAST